MAISYSFVDNKLYGTDDINNITKNLVGGGVAPFPSKSSYSLSDLNSLTSALVDSGVCHDGLKCSVSDGAVKVSEGILYFQNGVCLTVDKGGHEVQITPETAGYIAAHFDDSNQTADIIFCAKLPSSGFNVLLAEISADGTVLDKRTFARSKVGTLGENCMVTFIPSEENNCRYSGDLSKFNYALLLGTRPPGGSFTFYGTFDLRAGKFIYAIETDGYYKGYIRDSVYNLSMEIIDGELYVSKKGVKVILV